jgi:general secretion pathway protein H
MKSRISPASGEEGFTLLEMVCVVAIIALLAAILLPAIPHATSRPQLEAFALETASVLTTDRSEAMRRHQQIVTAVNAAARSIRSGATGRLVNIPGDVVFSASLPARCNERPAFSTISFFATGMSCGGSIILTRLGAGYEIRVNWLTGGVDVVAHNAR